MMDRFAVVGNPVAHSRSPQLHQQFARQTHREQTYDKIEAPLDGFVDTIARLQHQGYTGCNVTLPFKEQAYAQANELSERAHQAAAVNTIWFREDGSIFGDNTDGVGLVRDLTVNQGVSVAGKRVLVLGAGGAAHGILGPLLAQGPAELILANRTLPRAEQLKQKFAPLYPQTWFDCCGLLNLPLEPCDIVINATSIGVKGESFELDTGILGAQTVAYDLIYATDPTPFMCWAFPHAQQVIDGLGMLVEQGAESYALWTGERPDTVPVLAWMRELLGR